MSEWYAPPSSDCKKTAFSPLSKSDRRHLETALGWLGFGDLGAGVHAHPTATKDSVETLLQDLDLSGKVTILSGKGLADTPFDTPDILVAKGWNLESLEADYDRFIGHFSKFAAADMDASAVDEKKCFIIRSLLVHDYRRVLLRDPMLPAELLPAGWNGNRARALFQEIYRRVWEGAEQHLMTVLENETGKLPPAPEEFYRRFGGLKR